MKGIGTKWKRLTAGSLCRARRKRERHMATLHAGRKMSEIGASSDGAVVAGVDNHQATVLAS